MGNELFLLRHGQTEWNAERRHQGHLDSRLTPLGRAQAAAMGALLADLLRGRAGVVACVSPLGRARATAALALPPAGLTATPDDRLREVCLGAWQGLTDPEIFARWPASEALRRADPFGWSFTAPGGETLDQMKARLAAFLADLDRHAGPVVVVAHGGTLRVLRALALGLDDAGMRALPGGQGVIWHIAGGHHRAIAPIPATGAGQGGGSVADA